MYGSTSLQKAYVSRLGQKTLQPSNCVQDSALGAADYHRFGFVRFCPTSSIQVPFGARGVKCKPNERGGALSTCHFAGEVAPGVFIW